MKNQKISIVVVVIVLLAGLFLWNNDVYKKISWLNQFVDQEKNLTIPDPIVVQDSPAQVQGENPTLQNNLSKDETIALTASSNGSNVSVDERNAIANKVAKETGSIKIANCEANPVVLKVKSGTNYTFKNDSTKEVVVVFYKDNLSRPVPAFGEISVTADWTNDNFGLFGYYCTTSTEVHQGLVLMYK